MSDFQSGLIPRDNATPDFTAGLVEKPDLTGQKTPDDMMFESPISKFTSEAPGVLGNVGIGVAKGLGNTVSGISEGIHALPVVGKHLVSDEGLKQFHQMNEPKGIAQKAGYGAEQLGEFFIPVGGEGKAGVFAAEHLPWLGKMAAPLARTAVTAVKTGALNKLQGGDFTTGAAMGGATGALGEVAKAAAPAIAESALGITQRARGYGRTIGREVLDSTSGVSPGKVAESSKQAIGDLTSKMENAVHDATVRGVMVSTQPAHQALDEAIAKTPRNARDLIGKLNDLRDSLNLDSPVSGQAPRMIHTPDELLEIKRGVGKTISTWPPEWQRLDDVKRAKQGIYRALDSELDRTVSGNAKVNQKISSLIPAKQAAIKASQGDSLSQRVAGRMLAHTGALAGSVGGAIVGGREGGAPGAVIGGMAGLVAPEILGSRTAQMALARAASKGLPVTLPALRGAALQINRPRKKPEE